MHIKHWKEILQESQRGVIEESVWHILSRWAERIFSVFHDPTARRKINELMDLKEWLHNNVDDDTYKKFEREIEREKEKVPVRDKYGSPNIQEYNQMLDAMISYAQNLKDSLQRQKNVEESFIEESLYLIEKIDWGLISDKLREPFEKAWNWLSNKAKGDDTKAQEEKEKAQKELEKIQKEYKEKIDELDKQIKKDAEDKDIPLEQAREDNRPAFRKIQDWYRSTTERVISTVIEILSFGAEETIWDETEEEGDDAYQYAREQLDKTFKSNYDVLLRAEREGRYVSGKISDLRREYKKDVNALKKKYGYGPEYEE